jgi:hypothetical protein
MKAQHTTGNAVKLRDLVESYRAWPNAIRGYAKEIKIFSGDLNPAELNRFIDYLREQGKWAVKTIDKFRSAFTALREYAHDQGIVEHAPAFFGRGQDTLSPEANPEAYRWHYKPTAKRGGGSLHDKNCPVCGFSSKRGGNHRRVADAEPYKVFPWPFDRTWFGTTFHRLQDKAGIKRAEHFGLHNLRKTHATLLWEGSPAAAQLSLGHRSGSSVTAAHYIEKDGIVSRAIAALPTLGAFKGTNGKEGAA